MAYATGKMGVTGQRVLHEARFFLHEKRNAEQTYRTGVRSTH
jgi:hypothetical protein